MITPFSIARLPRIEFGAGSIKKLPGLIARYGNRVLLITGQRSFVESPHWPALLNALEKANVDWAQVRITDEPSPQNVDDAVREFHGQGFTAVAGIGGGSVLDAAKAIAGLLQVGDSVMDYLEGVGPEKPIKGRRYRLSRRRPPPAQAAKPLKMPS